MVLLSDNPSKKDTLGFEGMAEILHTVIRDMPEPPFTIGIFGEWGCGKTTLMKMVQERLEKNKVKTVWFNAWKYDGKEVIWNALIQTIFYTIQDDPELDKTVKGKELKERIKTAASKLAKYAAKVAVNFIPGGFVKPEVVDIVAEGLSPLNANEEQFEFINRFELEFDDLVKAYLGDENKYLVVFVDDLDRCLPETAIAVMEALKLYLDRANCIFVIGTESSIIEQGIRQRYKDNERLSAKEYLEKIIQLPFVMRGIDVENALSMLDPYKEVLDYRDDQDMRTLIVEGTKCNPRRIKRFINTFWVLSAIATHSKNGLERNLSKEQRQHLAKILLIQMRFPKLYYALVENQKIVIDLVDAIREYTTEDRDRILKKSEILEELYKDVELRKFLEKTRSITCEPHQIEPWIILTKGQPTEESSGNCSQQ